MKKWISNYNQCTQPQQYNPTHAVASLGWWHPGAATECVCHPFIFSWKTWRPFFCSSLLLSLSLFIAFTRVSPPRGCRPTPFYLSDLVSPLFFVNLPINFFLRVSPPGGCHPGRSAPPPHHLVTPLNSCKSSNCKDIRFQRIWRSSWIMFTEVRTLQVKNHTHNEKQNLCLCYQSTCAITR